MLLSPCSWAMKVTLNESAVRWPGTPPPLGDSLPSLPIPHLQNPTTFLFCWPCVGLSSTRLVLIVAIFLAKLNLPMCMSFSVPIGYDSSWTDCQNAQIIWTCAHFAARHCKVCWVEGDFHELRHRDQVRCGLLHEVCRSGSGKHISNQLTSTLTHVWKSCFSEALRLSVWSHCRKFQLHTGWSNHRKWYRPFLRNSSHCVWSLPEKTFLSIFSGHNSPGLTCWSFLQGY